MPILFNTTTTAQQIINSVAQDVRQTLSATDPTSGQSTLLDYVNRVSLELLRVSRWIFLLSPPQQFMTQLGITDYWVGPLGAGPNNAYDTGLNIPNLRSVKPKSVFDRTNFSVLGQVDEAPLSAILGFPDATSRPGRPHLWRQDETTPNVLNLYPAPDNQNIYSPQPESPRCVSVVGGSLPARMYFVSVSFIDSFGNESTCPQPAEVFIPANQLLFVYPPQEPLIAGTTGVRYDRYNVYAASAGTNTTIDLQIGNLTLQATGPTSTGFTESLSGLTTSGQVPPGTNNVEPLTGYFMEFRFYAQRVPITSLSQILQIPDDYEDVCIAGVNAMAFEYLTRQAEAQKWYSIYREGIVQMIRDINFMYKGGEYIQPDAATIGGFLPTVETLDLSNLTP